MELGLSLAQVGPFAKPGAVITFAREAEQRGYRALWALDRLLDTVAPRSRYPGNAEGSLPSEQGVALDPLLTLATAAAHTTQIRIGTNTSSSLPGTDPCCSPDHSRRSTSSATADSTSVSGWGGPSTSTTLPASPSATSPPARRTFSTPSTRCGSPALSATTEGTTTSRRRASAPDPCSSPGPRSFSRRIRPPA